MKLDKLVILIALLLTACTPKTPEQKIEASKTKQAELLLKIAGPAACSKINATVKPSPLTGVDVLGTYTNNCDKPIRYVELEVSCLNDSGNLIELDTEYVVDIYPGKDAYFQSPFMSSADQISECNIKVVNAEFK